MRVMIGAVYSRAKKRGEKPRRIEERYADVPLEVMAKLYTDELAMRHPERADFYHDTYAAMMADKAQK